MLFLVLHITCILGFFQLMRFTQQRQMSTMPLILINYGVGAVCAAFWCMSVWSGFGDHSLGLSLFGLSNGIGYTVHILIMFVCMKKVGVGLSATVASMSAVSPVMFAWLVYAESLSLMQVIALCLVPGVMLLCRAASDAASVQLRGASNLWLLANFALASAISIQHDIAERMSGSVMSEKAFYILCLFISATITCAFVVLKQKQRFEARAVYVGTGLGVLNVGATAMIILALQYLSSVAVFPVAACAIIIGSSLISFFLWHERLLVRQIVGLCGAALVITLINL